MTVRDVDELFERMSDSDLQIIERGRELLLLECDLISQLRKERDLTQTELAEILEIRQSAISQIENQEDVLVKTLERYIDALGGKLEIWARFPDRLVGITQFVNGLPRGRNLDLDMGCSPESDAFGDPQDDEGHESAQAEERSSRP